MSGTGSRTPRVSVPNVSTPGRRSDTPWTRWDATAVLEITLMSFEGGMEMTTSTATQRRELAQRTGDGIEVTLLWTESTNSVTLAVIDSHSAEELEFEVDAGCALDAFNHPYAYAAARRVRSADTTRVAA